MNEYDIPIKNNRGHNWKTQVAYIKLFLYLDSGAFKRVTNIIDTLTISDILK